MNPVDRATILQFHRDRTKECGRGSPLALGWKSEASQRVRFGVLCEIGDLNDRSVLDVGCGHGDLRAHLAETCPRVRYLGLDHSEAFLEVASQRYGHWPNTRFVLGDFSSAVLPDADYVLASGALGYQSREPDFVRLAITKLYAAARRGLAFNLLRRVNRPAGILAAYEPAVILDYCRQLTPHVALREGYWEDDFTVLVWRENL